MERSIQVGSGDATDKPNDVADCIELQRHRQRQERRAAGVTSGASDSSAYRGADDTAIQEAVSEIEVQ